MLLMIEKARGNRLTEAQTQNKRHGYIECRRKAVIPMERGPQSATHPHFEYSGTLKRRIDSMIHPPIPSHSLHALTNRHMLLRLRADQSVLNNANYLLMSNSRVVVRRLEQIPHPQVRSR